MRLRRRSEAALDHIAGRAIGIYPEGAQDFGVLARHRVTIAVVVIAYVTLGIGYFRVTKECWESRHANDPEEEVYGAGGAAVDVALWPLLLLVDAASPPSCDGTST